MNELIKSETIVKSVDLNNSELPDLGQAAELPIDLCGSYWTPEKEGESKRVFFIELKKQKVLSITTGELTELDCAVFAEQTDLNAITTISNGSRRLVGILEQYVNEGIIKKGVPLKITYLGKKKNKNNSYSSDNWSIKPLQINI